MKKILVTGGLGYIGSILIRDLLTQGFEVVIYDNFMMGAQHILDLMDNDKFSLIKGDIRDTEKLNNIIDGSFYAIVHLAAYVSHQLCENFQANTMEVNQNASIKLYKFASIRSIPKFIFISTCSNYGVTEGEKYATEDDQLHPLSLYAQTKVNTELELIKLAKTSKPRLTILRFGTIFGLSPRMRFDLLINEISMKATMGTKIQIYSPNSWRPYLHVKDASESIIQIINFETNDISSQIFNVLSFNINKNQLITEISKLIKVNFEIVEDGNDNRNYKVSNEKIKNKIGFEPKYNLIQGVVQIIEAIKLGIIEDPLDLKYTNDHIRWTNLDFVLE